MVDLIVHQLKQTHPELIPGNVSAVDAIRNATVPADLKRNILDRIWSEAGPVTLLSIGQGVRDVGYDPIWHAAVRSASPAVVFDKWRRFEAFGHSRNRLRIDQSDENSAVFRRYAIGGGTPTTPENLLICGLIVALLEENGCRGLRCDMPLADGTAHCIREGGRFSLPDDTDTLRTDSWTIEWQDFSPRIEHAAPNPAVPDLPLVQTCEPAQRASIETVARHLMSDAARQWKVGELARETGFSTRSLQRILGSADLSFSRLVRLVRIHEACRLLQHSDAPITAVGFCAGFSDSAHFSRDFRASLGMTPSDYRALC